MSGKTKVSAIPSLEGYVKVSTHKCDHEKTITPEHVIVVFQETQVMGNVGFLTVLDIYNGRLEICKNHLKSTSYHYSNHNNMS